MKNRSSNWAALAVAVLVAALGLQRQAGAADVTVEIQAQPLKDALREFGTQAGVQVMYRSEEVTTAGVMAPAVSGRLSAEEALTRLLSQSGLKYEFVNPTTVRIVSSGESHTSQARDENSSIRFAQARTTGQNDRSEGPNDLPSEAPKGIELEEIVVTGTHIRGPRETAAPVKVYSRTDIEQSGASTLEQFARKMPENFSSLDAISNLANSNAGRSVNGFSSGINLYNGSSFDLHGLGAGSTLTLLDGRRLSPAGNDGSAVDISLIPMAAIDRLEVLTDGASALYGSDAVSGVVNIITRKDYSGAQTRLQYGSSTDGGAGLFSGSQLFGANWSNGNAFLAYDYSWNEGLKSRDRDYIPDIGEPNLIIPRDRRNAVLAQLSQSLTDNIVMSGTVQFGKRYSFQEDTNESDIFNGAQVHRGNAEQRAAMLALDYSLTGDWRLQWSGSYSRVGQAEAVHSVTSSPFFPGPTVSELQNRSESRTTAFDTMADGTILSLPGGPLKAAIGVSYREEKFSDLGITDSVLVSSLSGRRNVRSAFAEMVVPMVGKGNAVRLMERLEVSAAVRYDRYSDFGSSTNPKIGLLWAPSSSLILRGSYGTSFRAPLLSQKNRVMSGGAQPLFNPGSPTFITNTFLIFGGNPDLEPEEADTWTAGIVMHPVSLPALRVTLDYFHVLYRDRLREPPSNPIFGNEALSPFIEFDPPLAEVEPLFDNSDDDGINFLYDITSDPVTGLPMGPAGVEAIVDLRIANMATTRESGLTFAPRYEMTAAGGDLVFSATLIRLLENDLQTTSASADLSFLNTFATPPKWKGNAEASWNRGPFTVAVTARYVGEYRNSLATPSQPINDWLTGDLYLGYRTGELTNTLLQGLTLGLNINNVTNERPPSVQVPADLPGESTIPFDSTNASPVGRFISVSVTKSW